MKVHVARILCIIPASVSIKHALFSSTNRPYLARGSYINPASIQIKGALFSSAHRPTLQESLAWIQLLLQLKKHYFHQYTICLAKKIIIHLPFGWDLWLRSFLTERSLRVVHGSSRSSLVPAVFGLPQGSVLAPLLFIIYTSDLLTLPLALPLMLCSPNCMQMMFRPTSTATPLMVPRPTGLWA